MAVVVKELNQSLINQANNNSMDGERGTAYFEYYKRLTDKIQTWHISDTKIQSLLDKLYQKYSEILKYTAQHVSGDKSADTYEQTLNSIMELDSWLNSIENTLENR